MATSSPSGGWADLALNQPGVNVEAKAKALRAAAPARSFVARLLRLNTDERAWRVGAIGERLVAEQLGRLGSSWRVLHSIQLSEAGTDLDHLVIGPGGVFSVNAKHLPNARVWVAGETFLVNGHRQGYVQASRAEGRKVARTLSGALGSKVAVTPVIAVVGARGGFQVKEQPLGVVVCARRALLAGMRSQPALLSPEEVEAIYSVARSPATWATSAKGPTLREGQPKPPLAPLPGEPLRTLGPGRAPRPSAKIVVAYSPAQGLRLYGDPRPHQAIVRTAGFRWSGYQRCWYVPESSGSALDWSLVESVVAQLRGVGFWVEVKPSY